MKVLVISHNCFSTYNNMGITLCSLFSGFRKEELCQLYIYPSLPDVDVCNSYYRITDKDILRSGVILREAGGPLDMDGLKFGKPAVFENGEDAAVYRREGNSRPLIRLLRDTMWRLSRWYTPRLRQWIQAEKPTCIFLAPGYAKFIYDVAMKISEDYKIPIVTYICDDYYFLKEPETALGRLQLRLLQKKTDQVMAGTSHLVAICQEISGCYSRKFGVPASVIMTGAGMRRQQREEKTVDMLTVSYLGNVRCNRWESLAAVGRELERISRETGIPAALDIYTSETERCYLDSLEEIGSVHIHGFVGGEEFQRVFRNSDLLLHVEAFDEESIDRVKHSVSTKLADSLVSGTPLLAYGPAGIASIQHLVRNDCAFVAASWGALGPELNKALLDPEERKRVAENGIRTAAEFHDQERNSRHLYEILQNVQEVS